MRCVCFFTKMQWTNVGRVVFKKGELGREITQIALHTALALTTDPIAFIDTAFIGHLGFIFIGGKTQKGPPFFCEERPHPQCLLNILSFGLGSKRKPVELLNISCMLEKIKLGRIRFDKYVCTEFIIVVLYFLFILNITFVDLDFSFY